MNCRSEYFPQHTRHQIGGWFRTAHVRELSSPIWAGLPARGAETFRAGPCIPSFSQVVAGQMARYQAVCLRSSSGSHGIHLDASRCRALWTRESCEFLVSTAERAENPRGVGEAHDSSLLHSLRFPERLSAAQQALRRFRIASGRKTTTAYPRSAKRTRFPSEHRDK